MRPRIFLPQAFAPADMIALPAAAARHVQVLRLQPGETVHLFNGLDGADWPAEIMRIGRRDVEVRLGAAEPVDRELPCAVTLAIGVPANDRMDALIEKAGELGAWAIQPLLCERSVLRLSGERAEARRQHWRGVAAAASEQSGRARVTDVRALQPLASWLAALETRASHKWLLSLHASARRADDIGIALGSADPATSIVVLSGPEGGLSADEENAAARHGFVRVALGPRVLRADTAPLALLAWLGLRLGGHSGASA